MGNFTQNDVFGGRYRLTRKLGIGGFSEVWQAEDEMTEGTVVAVKIYAPEKGLDEYGLKQFRREYSLTQPLNHPHLLKASYFDIADGSPFLVMPYCPNGSVGHQLMDRGSFEEKEIAQIVNQVAGGLSYLHSKDIVHQDIKPDNILIDDDNNYLLTDFGISSRMRSTLRKATTVSGALTVAYAPPERFDQNPQNTAAGDVFSMGVMLYELCEGDVPWMGSGGVSLLSGSKPPLISNKFTSEFGKLIQACLSLRMQDRPTAGQLQESAQYFLRTGKWDVSFIKDDSAAQADAPAFSSRGRSTERFDGAPSAPVADNTSFSNSRNESTPSGAPTVKQDVSKPASGSATRADFSPTEAKQKSKTPLIAAIVVVVLLLAGVGGYFVDSRQKAAAKQEQYDKAMADANQFVTGEKYADAKNAYLAALEVKPEDEAAKTGLAAIDDKIKVKYQEAMDAGNTLLNDKKYTEAIAKFTVALQYVPEDKDATEKLAQANFNIHIDAGDAALAAKDYAKAREEYGKALKNKKGDEVAQTKFDDAKREENAIKLAAVNGQLITGIKAGSVQQVKDAIAAGADANAHDGKTPVIFLAVKSGNLELVKTLVAAGAKCNDKSGTLSAGSASYGSPAIVAVANGKMDVLKYLLDDCKVAINDQEYDPNTKKNNGWSPLGAAASLGKLDIVKYLVGKGANVNIKQGAENYTPLLEASLNGHVEVVEYLLSKNADATATTSNGKNGFDLTKSAGVKALYKDLGLGGFTLEDNFSSYTSSLFFPDKKSISDANRTITVEGGKLVFFLKKDVGSSYTETFKTLDVSQDYSVQADFSITGTIDPYGLVFAGVPGNGDSYRIIIDQNGGYVALKKYSGGEWKSIVEYKQHSAIKQRSGLVNTIKMERKGTSVNIYINGQAVITNQSIPRMTGNIFGFFCQTIDTKLTVDNFKIEGVEK